MQFISTLKLRYGKLLLLSFLLFSTSVEARDLAESIGNFYDSAAYLSQTGMLQTIAAKEICSCRYVSGLDKKTCYEENNLGAMTIGEIALELLVVNFDEKNKTVKVKLPNEFTDKAAAIAKWKSPKFGCQLVKRPVDPIPGSI